MLRSPPLAPSGTRSRAGYRTGLAAAGLLLAALVAGHAWLNSRSILGRLRGEAERAVRARLGNVRLGDLEVDWLGRVAFGPVAVPASRPGLPAVVRVERVRVGPRWLALLAGRAEAGTVTLEGARVEAGSRGEEIAALAGRLRARPRAAARGVPSPAADPPEVRFHELTVVLGPLSHGGPPLVLGPFDGAVAPGRSADGPLRVEVRLPAGGRVRAEWTRGGRSGALRASVAGLGADDLPEAVRALLPFEISGGTLHASLASEGPAQAGSARIEAEANGLVLEGERLAPEPVGPIRAAFRGVLRWDAAAGRVALEDGILAVGEHGAIHAGVSGEVILGEDPSFTFEAHADRIDYAAALEALPPQLVPAEEGPRLAGALGARLALAGPLHRPAEWKVAADLDIGGLRRSARAADPLFLQGTFTWWPAAAAGGTGRGVVVGPENPDFVPVAELPAHVIRAVTTSEDAGFFAHHGFDFEEMKNALAEAAGAGRTRGASTITQQLAKNLFLSRERTIARKVREAFLTLALEASLPKARLLEIYLNIVEWGPGVHGIGEAARHWFGKDARALTPREAAFLASVIPSPMRFHAYFATGEISGAFLQRVDGLLVKMRDQGQLTDAELIEALGEPLVFARG